MIEVTRPVTRDGGKPRALVITVHAEPLQAGIHTIPEATYHADPCPEPSLSNSIIKLLTTKSPRHAWLAHPRLNPQHEAEQNPVFDFGTAAHALLLEERDVCVVVDAPDWRTKAAQTARDEAYGAGKVPLLTRQHESLAPMVAAARGFLCAARLEHVLAAGLPEQTLVWQEGLVWCRGRADWLTDDRRVILDYKTTNAVNPDKWMRAASELSYDTQASFYLRGLRKLGYDRTRFLFLVQESVAPYCCYLVELAESMRHLADLKVERSINLWGQCLAASQWPAYTTDVYQMEARPWDVGAEQ